MIPWTADDEAYSFYSELMKKKPNFKKDKSIIKLFKNILDKELEIASKILKIKINLNLKGNKFDKIRKKYPNSVFEMVKSAKEFMKIIK